MPSESQKKNGPSEDGEVKNNSLYTVKGRKRKGSLRKTALLGPGRLRSKSNSPHRLPELEKSLDVEEECSSGPAEEKRIERPEPVLHSLDDGTNAAIPVDSPTSSSNDCTSEPSDQNPNPTLTSPTEPPSQNLHSELNPLAIPQVVSRLRYASTTDDDDSSSSVSLHPPNSLQRKRSARSTHHSPPKAHPLAHVHPSADEYPFEEWDYAETATWGWVILILTWVVFIVGMGSCLGVWSWAWDVGETPYAPPELEDDPTLPIVGYYPALLILSSVMAWVWVIVAWVGMKYFRHAKVGVDE